MNSSLGDDFTCYRGAEQASIWGWVISFLLKEKKRKRFEVLHLLISEKFKVFYAPSYFMRSCCNFANSACIFATDSREFFHSLQLEVSFRESGANLNRFPRNCIKFTVNTLVAMALLKICSLTLGILQTTQLFSLFSRDLGLEMQHC